MKSPTYHTLILEKIVGGGQAIGTLDDGRKCFVWGGLPGETVIVRETKRKSRLIEAVVTEVVTSSPQRITPHDPDSYLSTSPWQIMNFDAEQHYKAALIEGAFELHDIVLPDQIDVYTDGHDYHYRNKVEFSWYGETDAISGVERLQLAFFRRGSKGKIPVDACALLPEPVIQLAREIRDFLSSQRVEARQLKTLLIRCNRAGDCVWQLYIKSPVCDFLSPAEASLFRAQGGEVIYSDPRSPASRITERLLAVGDTVLTDTVLGVPFRYATEGFFQINLPVYEQALRDMRLWLDINRQYTNIPPCPSPQCLDHESSDFPSELGQDILSTGDRACLSELSTATADKLCIVDMYAGVGSIGLSIGGSGCTLVELDESAVREMRRNIEQLGSDASAVLAASEQALDYITADKIIIVDPPRAGLHADVIARLLEVRPLRIIYLSCNPVTQARDTALLATSYGIRAHRGYNFFPRTPHIEHLVVLDRKESATIQS